MNVLCTETMLIISHNGFCLTLHKNELLKYKKEIDKIISYICWLYQDVDLQEKEEKEGDNDNSREDKQKIN